MRKRQSLNATAGHIVVGKCFHHRCNPSLFTFNASFFLFNSGKWFSTKDQDNDLWSSSCAVSCKGAWWYRNCHGSNLNGQYLGGPHDTYADGINWKAFRGYHYSLKRSEMKLRPQQWQIVMRSRHGKVHTYELRSISFLTRIYEWIEVQIII